MTKAKALIPAQLPLTCSTCTGSHCSEGQCQPSLAQEEARCHPELFSLAQLHLELMLLVLAS